MLDRYCRMAYSLMLLILLVVGACPNAMAFSLRLAPLEPPAREADAFAPSTSVPVTPQFFRVMIARQQAIIAVETPYVRIIEPVSPVRFSVKKLSRAKPVPLSHTPPASPRYQLRGPETLLLRHTQTASDR